MSREIYRYAFPTTISLEDIESTIVLTILAVESLHGDARVRLELRHYLDQQQRKCVVDAGTTVGSDFNRLFAGFLLREFGSESFAVERVDKEPVMAAR